MVVFYLLDTKFLHFSETTMISSSTPDKSINLTNSQQIITGQSINKLPKKINDLSLKLVFSILYSFFVHKKKEKHKISM